jgi:hypothetical protein
LVATSLLLLSTFTLTFSASIAASGPHQVDYCVIPCRPILGMLLLLVLSLVIIKLIVVKYLVIPVDHCMRVVPRQIHCYNTSASHLIVAKC